MTGRRLVQAFTLLILCTLPAFAEEGPSPFKKGTVTWVYDGDTLEISPHGKVRLIGIDTPESKDSRRDRKLIDKGVSATRQREIYREAKLFNITNVKGAEVRLETDAHERDRYGR